MDISQKVEFQKPLAPLTSIHIGGQAAYYIECRNIAEIRESLLWAKNQNMAVHVLGGGSNTLFDDGVINALVIHVHSQNIRWLSSNTVLSDAGVNWDRLVSETVAKSLYGLECLVGIPGTVGATPIQNVGAYGQEVSNTIESVSVLDRVTLDTMTFTNAQCDFSYRSSRFKEDLTKQYIVTDVTYRLAVQATKQLQYDELRNAVASQVGLEADRLDNLSDSDYFFHVTNCVRNLRGKKGMLIDPSDPESRSLGSFFTNPILTFEQVEDVKRLVPTTTKVPSFPVLGTSASKVSAAWLIEQCGFKKGERRGDVSISAKHSLALVNKGRAKSTEVIEFASKIQDAVFKKFGVRLELEPTHVKFN
jgi:UDP-N-acetylmuramate dehydrogenase